ncbi:MAG: hypothetical protein ACLS4A_09385 [Oscillospiraceae bacterium]|jgi:hypothetical protein
MGTDVPVLAHFTYDAQHLSTIGAVWKSLPQRRRHSGLCGGFYRFCFDLGKKTAVF